MAQLKRFPDGTAVVMTAQTAFFTGERTWSMLSRDFEPGETLIVLAYDTEVLTGYPMVKVLSSGGDVLYSEPATLRASARTI